MYKYIIRGDDFMALAVHSEMLWHDFAEYVRVQSLPRNKREMPCFKWGVLELVNPKVMSPNDFADFLPALI
jgi:hypothetical protein